MIPSSHCFGTSVGSIYGEAEEASNSASARGAWNNPRHEAQRLSGEARYFSSIAKIKAGMRHGVHCDPPAPSHTRAGERSLDVMRWGLVPFWAKDHESRFHEYQRQSRGDRGQARLPRSVPAAALPGAGLVCHRWSRPTGHETGGTVLPRVVGTEVGRVQAREAASRHDGLN
jgi:hypothetical protein